jgi:hypothetical protein
MWPPSQSERRKGRLVASRRRRRQLNLAGDHFLEERVLLSTPDPSSALVSPQFTHLVEPLPVNPPPIVLPVLPPVDSSGSQAMAGAPSSEGPEQPQAGLTLTPQTAGGSHDLGFIDTLYTYPGGFNAGTAGSYNDFYFSTVADGPINFGA